MARFAQAESGSLLPIFAISLVPLMLAVGMSVDYSSAVSSKATMQSALDAATLSLTTLPKSTSEADRTKQLQDVFAANGGQGMAAVLPPVYDADGTLHLSASATYSMPTNFMKIATISNVDINVQTKVVKKPSLIEATFNVDHVSGYWGKTMYLYGTEFETSTEKVLMKIVYTYKEYKYSYKSGNKTYTAQDPKGYGTTNIYTVSGTTDTLVQSQVCTPVGQKTDFTPSATAFRSFATATNGSSNGATIYFKTTCVTTNSPGNSSGAKIDVSKMNQLYLLMDVPSGPVKKLKSNDTATSDRLYIGAGYATAAEKALKPSTYAPVEVAKNKTVDIFSAVPCSQTSDQAWEDGGNAVPADVSNADFFYSITGKCDYNQRIAQTRITE
ncbi:MULTISPECIES: TadE/TadG family type IV pilus assembly protein [unclassified Mesorhizobium]|uniref:TadE/TadG family type IV pilus assembly protein n=1 Tax=unclassified Mesorhizobium TaxID=325217 RepID=UPI001FCD8596|nr:MULTISPECIES: TadE/TadG family type IV pilus assembly protein [unclassified Mesorhizobium]